LGIGKDGQDKVLQDKLLKANMGNESQFIYGTASTDIGKYMQGRVDSSISSLQEEITRSYLFSQNGLNGQKSRAGEIIKSSGYVSDGPEVDFDESAVHLQPVILSGVQSISLNENRSMLEDEEQIRCNLQRVLFEESDSENSDNESEIEEQETNCDRKEDTPCVKSAPQLDGDNVLQKLKNENKDSEQILCESDKIPVENPHSRIVSNVIDTVELESSGDENEDEEEEDGEDEEEEEQNEDDDNEDKAESVDEKTAEVHELSESEDEDDDQILPEDNPAVCNNHGVVNEQQQQVLEVEAVKNVQGVHPSVLRVQEVVDEDSKPPVHVNEYDTAENEAKADHIQKYLTQVHEHSLHHEENSDDDNEVDARTTRSEDVMNSITELIQTFTSSIEAKQHLSQEELFKLQVRSKHLVLFLQVTLHRLNSVAGLEDFN